MSILKILSKGFNEVVLVSSSFRGDGEYCVKEELYDKKIMSDTLLINDDFQKFQCSTWDQPIQEKCTSTTECLVLVYLSLFVISSIFHHYPNFEQQGFLVILALHCIKLFRLFSEPLKEIHRAPHNFCRSLPKAISGEKCAKSDRGEDSACKHLSLIISWQWERNHHICTSGKPTRASAIWFFGMTEHVSSFLKQ